VNGAHQRVQALQRLALVAARVLRKFAQGAVRLGQRRGAQIDVGGSGSTAPRTTPPNRRFRSPLGDDADALDRAGWEKEWTILPSESSLWRNVQSMSVEMRQRITYCARSCAASGARPG